MVADTAATRCRTETLVDPAAVAAVAPVALDNPVALVTHHSPPLRKGIPEEQLTMFLVSGPPVVAVVVLVVVAALYPLALVANLAGSEGWGS
jgi:hypothetical protein